MSFKQGDNDKNTLYMLLGCSCPGGWTEAVVVRVQALTFQRSRQLEIATGPNHGDFSERLQRSPCRGKPARKRLGPWDDKSSERVVSQVHYTRPQRSEMFVLDDQRERQV